MNVVNKQLLSQFVPSLCSQMANRMSFLCDNYYADRCDKLINHCFMLKASWIFIVLLYCSCLHNNNNNNNVQC